MQHPREKISQTTTFNLKSENEPEMEKYIFMKLCLNIFVLERATVFIKNSSPALDCNAMKKSV